MADPFESNESEFAAPFAASAFASWREKTIGRVTAFFSRFASDDASPEIKRRIALLAGIPIIGIINLIPFGILAFIQGNFYLAVFDLGTAALLCLNLVDARKRKRYDFNIQLGTCAAAGLYIYLYYSGGVKNSAFVWYFTFPLIAFFLLGSKKGGIATLLMTLPVLFLMFFDSPIPFYADYPIDLEIRFLFAYLVVCTFAWLFENAQEKNRRELWRINENLERMVENRTGDLAMTNRQLLREIEEKIEAEKALRESELRFRTAFNQSYQFFGIIHPDGRIAEINELIEKTCGQDRAAVINTALVDAPWWVQSQRLRIGMLSAMENALAGRIAEGEFDFMDKDKAVRLVQCSFAPIKNENDKVLFIAFQGQDITERRQSEGALKKSHERFIAVLDGIDAHVYVADTKTHEILFMNKKMQDDFGSNTTGQPCYRIFRNGTEPCGDCTNPRLVDTRGKPTGLVIWEGQNPITGKWYLNHDRAIPWIDGRLVRIQVATEITAMKEMERQRIELEKRLFQAQKMESVGRLAGGVAHDFNNMLGVILGRAELAMKRVDPALPEHADLEEILKATRRSADLTRQLLAFARRQTAEPKVLDLNDTVTGMLKMLRRLIGEDLDLVWKPGAGLWPIKIDPAQVDQILANLCVNARDAISGVGQIIIQTQNTAMDAIPWADNAEADPGDFVMIAVSDDGCGMNTETLGQIFEPFFTTKGVGEGTGLGLATVYGIVKQNSGFINVYSEPGQGATFKIYLPRSEETEEAAEISVSHTIAKGTETVLVVEDEESILSLGKNVLELYGYTVLAAGTPGEALAMVEQHKGPIHLLVTDVVMPEMDGKELKARIEKLKPDIKVLFMSGYTADVIMNRGIIEKDVHFLQKPFSVQTLAGKVREVMDRQE